MEASVLQIELTVPSFSELAGMLPNLDDYPSFARVVRFLTSIALIHLAFDMGLLAIGIMIGLVAVL